ncbi:CinA family protein [uncultured Cellulomonas sp.]|uniref:CinA family protein n=1 Tax=uncultured Cellulomonas sp. TaxID=189682 RepID=UPI0026367A67|nr:CinA family protein [uncultured Cellulomonas sp.]
MTGTDAGPHGDAAAPPAPGAVLAEAQALVAELVGRGLTVAVAESLTGGSVTSALVDVPGASRALRGGIVSYATVLKAELLDVDRDLLRRAGAVDPDVARQMARGVRTRLGADVGLATTGVAGPDPQDGHAPGEVHVAVATADAVVVRSLRLAGDRAAVRAGAVRAVLTCAADVLAGGRR